MLIGVSYAVILVIKESFVSVRFIIIFILVGWFGCVPELETYLYSW